MICNSCHKPHGGRHLTCKKCGQRKKELMRLLRIKRKSQGLCGVCGKRPVKTGCTSCDICLLSRAKRQYPYRKICTKRACHICGYDVVVHIHHIDGNHKNNVPENLIPLCPNHHYEVETKKLIL
jgi:hypothetical protein